MNIFKMIHTKIKQTSIEEIFYYHLWRKLWSVTYKLIFSLQYKKFGKCIYISPLATIRWKSGIELGSHSTLSRGSVVWTKVLCTGTHFGLGLNSEIYGRVKCGDHVMVWPNSSIIGGNHGMVLGGGYMDQQKSSSVGILIGNDVWIQMW